MREVFMAQNREKEQEPVAQVSEQPPSPARSGSTATGVVLLTALAYICCLLVSIAPLQRLYSTIHFAQVKTNRLLTLWGSWLPANLHLAKNAVTSQHSTAILELLLLVALLFGIYGLSALLLQRQPANSNYIPPSRLIVLAVIPIGLILLLAPVLVSPDVFTYADYGLGISAFHANPYFVPPTAHLENPLIAFDPWRSSTAASGPLWLAVCSFVAKVATDHPLRYILAFRLLGLTIQLVNSVLVAAILRKLGRSPRTITTGTLLYAWNPLILIETCLNGHNDALVLTFLLLGILLSMQTERVQHSQFLQPGSYLPPLIAFTLAALIQPLATPVAILFLILLARKAFTIAAAFPETAARRQRPAIITLSGILVMILVMLALYGPFWIGHSPSDILASLRSAPPAQFAQGSILAAIQQWNVAHGRPAGFAATLSQHSLWDAFSALVIIVGLVIGGFSLWRVPTVRNLVLIALTILTAVLIITPWFQPSYLVWLVGMAVVLLSTGYERLKWALIAFALTATISALLVYLYNGYQSTSSWILLTPLLIFGPPLLAFLVAFFLKDTFFLADLWNGPVHHAMPLPTEEVDIEARKKTP